ncbi:lysophospholipid acyltransferase family protein [Sulfurimonas sp. HSL-1716]|uniref:lysophospholipid acyltransferase family protein n=1 Tax=Hydrocurvibacter sulfurireducens TaxID=3131937 RepID=UPI0031F94479
MQVSVENYLQHNYSGYNKLPSLLKNLSSAILKKLFHENEINSFLAKNRHKDSFGFVEAVLDHFNVDITIHKNQLQRIPSYGRCVVIANHPLGALDALALLYVLKDVRKDIKIVATTFLASIENLGELIIPVDNIRGKMEKSSLEKMYDALKKEQLIIVFPSGEVSRARVNGIKDTKWRSGFLRIASKMQAPILPIYINAKNSKFFYTLSSLNKSLATITLPNEMFKFYGKKIEFKIGKSIPYENYNIPALSTKDTVKLFKKHLERLATNKSCLFKTQNEIALAENHQELKNELLKAKALGETKDGKKIFQYSSTEETSVLKEIGRLREISFRHVKEGSGKKRDIDEYDLIYEHIVLWDDNDLEIVGSYRVAKTKEVLEKYSKEGLYTATLFDYQESFQEYFAQGLELGRSFIQPKYQNSRALDYLWQGIGAYLRENANIRYMFGPVSISKSYNYESTAMMIYFYMNYFGSDILYVKHKERFIISSQLESEFEKIFELDNYKKDLITLRDRLQLQGLAIPTLYKQYSDLCEDGGVMFTDFGLDKDFEDCVDGFIIVDITKLKAHKRERYMG